MKPFYTYEQQIEKLKNANLIIEDENQAIDCLKFDGYYNRLCHNKQLINSHFYRGVSELPYKLEFDYLLTRFDK